MMIGMQGVAMTTTATVIMAEVLRIMGVTIIIGMVISGETHKAIMVLGTDPIT